MALVGQVLATFLWLYWLILIGRLILDFVQIFARSWRRAGTVIIAEAIYTVTDPPLRLLRKVIRRCVSVVCSSTSPSSSHHRRSDSSRRTRPVVRAFPWRHRDPHSTAGP